jgi:AraC-like DNA-binding protein
VQARIDIYQTWAASGNNNMLSDDVFFTGLVCWIRENLTRKVTVQEVAARYGYSKWYLNRCFVRYAGISLGAFIRLERMKAAADELISGDQRIITIALRYDFESQQTFTRAFSRQYGMPPGAFRQVMRKAKPEHSENAHARTC